MELRHRRSQHVIYEGQPIPGTLDDSDDATPDGVYFLITLDLQSNLCIFHCSEQVGHL